MDVGWHLVAPLKSSLSGDSDWDHLAACSTKISCQLLCFNQLYAFKQVIWKLDNAESAFCIYHILKIPLALGEDGVWLHRVKKRIRKSTDTTSVYWAGWEQKASIHPSIHHHIHYKLLSFTHRHTHSQTQKHTLQSAYLCGSVGGSWCIWRKPSQAGGEQKDLSWNRREATVLTEAPLCHHCFELIELYLFWVWPACREVSLTRSNKGDFCSVVGAPMSSLSSKGVSNSSYLHLYCNQLFEWSG